MFEGTDDRNKFYNSWKTSNVINTAKQHKPKQCMLKVKKSLRTSLIATLLIIACVSIVMASILWSQTLPSTVTVTASYSCELYDDVGLTTLATSVDFPSIEKTNPNWYLSQKIYVKYTGSGSPTPQKYFKIVASIPSGFSWQWSVDGTVKQPTDSLGWNFETKPTLETQIYIKHDGSINEGNYDFAFTYQVTD